MQPRTLSTSVRTTTIFTASLKLVDKLKLLFFNKIQTATYGRTLGGHAIMIVGWGNMKVNGTDTPYWQAVNSWGPTWGYVKQCKLIREKQFTNALPMFI